MSAIEDLIDDRVDADHVSRRIDDWLERLRDLYAQLRCWLPSEWSVVGTEQVAMHEEMMRKFGLPARRLPAMLFADRAGETASIKPKGLWIIGANGTLNLRVPSGLFLVVDTAENFASPIWEIAEGDDRMSLVPLDARRFRATLQP